VRVCLYVCVCVCVSELKLLLVLISACMSLFVTLYSATYPLPPNTCMALSAIFFAMGAQYNLTPNRIKHNVT
jgi:galactitol-specific phosphotransferase system IIC component